MPASRSWESLRMDNSKSCISMLSVISISTPAVSSIVGSMAETTRSTKSRRRSCNGETLTATRMVGMPAMTKSRMSRTAWSRTHSPTSTMAPERLKPLYLATFNIDLRLVVEQVFLTIEGPRQPCLQRYTPRRRALRNEPVQHVLLVIFASSLERCLGILHQNIGVISVVRIECDSATDCRPQFLSLDTEGFDEYLRRRVLQQPTGIFRTCYALEHQGECSAAEICHAVRIRECLFKPH